MQPDLNSLTNTLAIPKKKWFEGEQRRDLFFPCTVVQARYRLQHAIDHRKRPEFIIFQNIKPAWEINFEKDYFKVKITAYTRSGTLTHYCFGKLLESTNGSLVQIIIRDTSLLQIVVGVCILLFSVAVITQIFAIVVICFFFYGLLFTLGFIIGRKSDLNEAVEIITNILS